MNKIFLILPAIIIVSSVYANNPADTATFKDIKTPVGISYFGDYLGTKPGLNITLENTLKIIFIHKKTTGW
ncbi:MAG: hypothetical protein ABIJ97_01590 [Bacteroidota bacterium]